MKKISFILGIGLFALASCSSDDIVDKTANGALESKTPIGFSITTPNMGRDGDGTGLETVRYDFGVYAYKGDTYAAVTNIAAANTVMDNYLVGYYDQAKDWGYKPLADQLDNTDGSYWFYEGLGNTQGPDPAKSFDFKTGGKQAAASTAANGEQFLKYWDLSKQYTYFFGCAPYDIASFHSDANGVYFTYPTIDEATPGYDDYMFASQRMTNSSHADVNLHFQRLASQVRVAFYEQIDGYDVRLIDYSVEKAGVFFIPAVEGTPAYSAGSYLAKATPSVYFDWSDAKNKILSEVKYDIPEDGWSSSPMVFGINTFKDKAGASSVTLGDGTTTDGVRDLLMGPTKSVIPSDADNANSGFTLSVNFQLEATDTHELINVYGAKVFVAANNFVWEPNNLYTYIFKITKNVKGSTKPDPDPEDPTPDPEDALYPIIFDDIQIDNYKDNVVGEWNIND